MKPQVRASLASWPGLSHFAAMRLAACRPSEPLIGELLTDHVQLVPQGTDVLDEHLASVLVNSWPGTSFRLHANVRVLPERRLADLSSYGRHLDWFRAAARVHRTLRSVAYSAHAGRRHEATFNELLDNVRRCADLFECPVAVEGMYPVDGAGSQEFLISTWQEYQALLESAVPYALDLSHLNILAHRCGRRDDVLVGELLASPACMEVHVSANDGLRDANCVLQDTTWCWPLLGHLQPLAVIFA